MKNCTFFPQCTGCTSWNTPYPQQKLSKIFYLESLLKEKRIPLFNEIEFISCGEYGLRHRVDFTIQFDSKSNTHKIGFYNIDKSIVHIDRCIQLDLKLQEIYSEFIKFNFFYGDTPIRKGSIRLRTGPENIKGCWLDFSNIDVKNLLSDKRLLTCLLDAGFIVEIGQKGKRLNRSHGLLKLVDSQAEAWFKTIGTANEQILLYSLISDFTQPSWISAEKMVKITLDWITERNEINSVLEFGSGIGQFTLGFLKHNLTVDAFEINKSAVKQLLFNARNHGLEESLKIKLGDFHKQKVDLTNKYNLVFVNPARSGLKSFSDEIISLNPQYLIYISCFPETMAQDLAAFSKNFEVCNIKIIDQFPQTKHFETCVFLKNLHQ